nr:MAG TPA: multi-glycosylated core protein [Caudoviricetes sp.]
MDSMDTKQTLAVGGAGSLIGGILTALQYDEVLRWINLALAIMSALTTIAFTIYKWYKSAKKDGHIDIDEVDELLSKLQDETDKMKDSVDKELKENEDEKHGNAGEGD